MGALLNLALELEVAESRHADTQARDRRVHQALQLLRAVPTRSAAFVAAEVSDGVVPVTVVIRTAEGMVTGDLEIPEDRWNPWLFLEFLGEQDRGLPS